MSRVLRFIAGDVGPSSRLLVMSYFGTPFVRVLPFRLRLAAGLISIYLHFRPQTFGGVER